MNIKRFFACLAIAVFTLASTAPVSASANDFYFSSANFDYLLTSDGKLKATETLTAEFPNTDQNHGLTRVLPYKSRNGSNIILPSTDGITVTRNGELEPISKIEKESDGYYIYIGRASEYVHGSQTYEISYAYENIVTEFTRYKENVTGTKTAEDYQELYLNVNGDGWGQRFDKITATLRFGDSVEPLSLNDYNKITSLSVTSDLEDLAVWCYAPSSTTCETTSDNSSITFSAEDIPRRSSLTFSVEFAPGTIAVPDQKVSYLFLITSLALLALLVFWAYKRIQRWRENAEIRAKRKSKKAYYKSRFVAPQYAPLDGLTVAGAKELYLGPKRLKSEYVATLLELAVRGHISIVKNHPEREQKTGLSKYVSFGASKNDNWSIKINDLNITDAEMKVLKLLNGKLSTLSAGQTIKITTHTASSSLALLTENFATETRTRLHNLGFLESLDKKVTSSLFTTIFVLIIFFFCFAPLLPIIFAFLLIPLATLADSAILNSLSLAIDGLFNDLFTLGATQFLAGPLCVILSLATTAFLIIFIITINKKSKFDRYAEKGLDASKHLDGLYLYIKMAEADRLKLLQSVDGADTSSAGIVKLYEKLLPYAALFGLEKSWMNELEKYYHLEEIEDPTWCNSIDAFSTGFVNGALASSVTSSVASATPAASGGSSSSGGFDSGGGGGGSDGGGSGGGGGGGW